jgi:hypothetical protein
MKEGTDPFQFFYILLTYKSEMLKWLAFIIYGCYF